MPKNYTNEIAVKEISKLFIKNTISLGKICEAYNVQCFRFLQPVAAVDYTPPENDALTIWVQDKEKKSRYKIGYSSIRNFTNKNLNKSMYYYHKFFHLCHSLRCVWYFYKLKGHLYQISLLCKIFNITY